MLYKTNVLRDAFNAMYRSLKTVTYENTYRTPSRRHIAVSNQIHSMTGGRIFFPTAQRKEVYAEKIVLFLLLSTNFSKDLYRDVVEQMYSVFVQKSLKLPAPPDVELVMWDGEDILNIFKMCRWMDKDYFIESILARIDTQCESKEPVEVTLADYIANDLIKVKNVVRRHTITPIAGWELIDNTVFYPANIFAKEQWRDADAESLRCVFVIESDLIHVVAKLQPLFNAIRGINIDIVHLPISAVDREAFRKIYSDYAMKQKLEGLKHPVRIRCIGDNL